MTDNSRAEEVFYMHRFFASQEITVLRFTGSEIFRTPEKCVTEITGIVSNAWNLLGDKAA